MLRAETNERPADVLTPEHPVQPRAHDPAQDAEPEALRRRDRQAHDRLRHRPGRHRQDLPGDGQGRAGAAGQGGQPDHPDPPGGRGRRAARVPARHAQREDRPLPAPAVRRAARHARPRDRSRKLLAAGTIEVAPLAYMRGRTLNDAFIILDEAQNTSPEQMKMFLTRLGFGSKIVVTGDVTQVDLPARHQVSGLRDGRGHPRRRSRTSPSAGSPPHDVVRHRLVGAHRRRPTTRSSAAAGRPADRTPATASGHAPSGRRR